MIIGLWGKPGGFKSYSAVEWAFGYVARGGVVCTNIPLHAWAWRRELRERKGWRLQRGQLRRLESDDIPRFNEHIPQGTRDMPVLVIIDECHLWFNSRDWAKQARSLLNFLTIHRHCHVDIVLISQHMDNVDKQMRRLVEHTYLYRDLRRMKVGGVGYPFPHLHFTQVDVNTKSVMDSGIKVIRAWVFSLYDSFSHNAGQGGNMERAVVVKAAGVINDNQGMTYRGLLVIVAALALIWGADKWRQAKKEDKLGKLEKRVAALESRPASVARLGKSVPSVVPVDVPVDAVDWEKLPSVVRERGRGVLSMGSAVVILTEKDRYEAGCMCHYGLVESVTANGAQVLCEDGKRRLVVGES